MKIFLKFVDCLALKSTTHSHALGHALAIAINHNHSKVLSFWLYRYCQISLSPVLGQPQELIGGALRRQSILGV
ncbi:hypothetical protein [Pseudanabaena sp. 'Roaring Creek']|uniref:hypothetical protein n=1 Tax=Pseudanabaena sp. 'Roaring Creek' TaxID=1681830 RepID=UPI0006D7F5F2|nr:hypothetical protein [Pseudanabaena sp. 'Roaring Creek']